MIPNARLESNTRCCSLAQVPGANASAGGRVRAIPPGPPSRQAHGHWLRISRTTYRSCAPARCQRLSQPGSNIRSSCLSGRPAPLGKHGFVDHGRRCGGPLIDRRFAGPGGQSSASPPFRRKRGQARTAGIRRLLRWLPAASGPPRSAPAHVAAAAGCPSAAASCPRSCLTARSPVAVVLPAQSAGLAFRAITGTNSITRANVSKPSRQLIARFSNTSWWGASTARSVSPRGWRAGGAPGSAPAAHARGAGNHVNRPPRVGDRVRSRPGLVQ